MLQIHGSTGRRRPSGTAERRGASGLVAFLVLGAVLAVLQLRARRRGRPSVLAPAAPADVPARQTAP